MKIKRGGSIIVSGINPLQRFMLYNRNRFRNELIELNRQRKKETEKR